jgi:hypothetical protein
VESELLRGNMMGKIENLYENKWKKGKSRENQMDQLDLMAEMENSGKRRDDTETAKNRGRTGVDRRT